TGNALGSPGVGVSGSQFGSPMPEAGPQFSGSQTTPFSQRESPAGRGVTTESSPNGSAVRAMGSTTVAGAIAMRDVPPGQWFGPADGRPPKKPPAERDQPATAVPSQSMSTPAPVAPSGQIETVTTRLSWHIFAMR